MDKTITVSSTRTTVNHIGERRDGVRVYRSQPERVELQIRTVGPTNGAGSAGVVKACYSQASLSLGDLNELIDMLNYARDCLLNKREPR